MLVPQPPGDWTDHIKHSVWNPWRMKLSRFPFSHILGSTWRICIMFSNLPQTSCITLFLLFCLLTSKAGITVVALSRAPGGCRDLVKVWILSLFYKCLSVFLHSLLRCLQSRASEGSLPCCQNAQSEMKVGSHFSSCLNFEWLFINPV